MFQILLIIVFLMLNQVSSFAIKEDTLYSKTKDVIVFGKKSNKEDKYLSSYSISKNEISLYPNESIVSALKFIPNLNIIEYGGLESIKSANIRGFNSKQTTISINGFKINNNQSGVFDLNLLNAFDFDEIEINCDGNSALKNAGNMGGGIDFKTDLVQNKFLSFSGEYNFYGASNFKSSVYSHVLEIPFKLSLNFQNSNGKYPIEVNEFGENKEYSRENAQASLFGLWITSQKVFNNFSYNLDFGLSNIDKGIPGAIIQGNLENTSANFIATNYFALFKTAYFDNKQLIELKLGMIAEDSKFEDIYIDAYQNQSLLASIAYNRELYGFNFNAEIDFEKASLKSNALQNSQENISRNNYALSLDLEKEIAEINIWKINSLAAFKQNFADNYDNLNSFFLGLNLTEVQNKHSVSLNFSKNYRLPTFNELYFKNYGNLDLLPEKSYSLAINSKYVLNKYYEDYIALDFFYSNINDYIISVPKNAVIWSAQNIAIVENWGFGFTFAAIPNFIFSYSLQFPKDDDVNSLTYKKLLPYQNNENIALKFALNFKEILSTFSLALNYKSHRYFTSDNDYYSLMKPYTLLDFAWNYFENFDNSTFILKFEVFNILNTNFEVIRSYPMPLRSFKFTFEYLYD